MVNFIFFFIFWLIGGFLGAFTIGGQVLPSLFFAIPSTLKLIKFGILKNGKVIIKDYIISSVILTIIFLVVTYSVYRFAGEAGFYGYIIGIIWIFIFGGALRHIAPTRENVEDYVNLNRKYFTTIQFDLIYDTIRNKN